MKLSERRVRNVTLSLETENGRKESEEFGLKVIITDENNKRVMLKCFRNPKHTEDYYNEFIPKKRGAYYSGISIEAE